MNISNDMGLLYKLASEFRGLIEVCVDAEEEFPLLWDDFPINACKPISMLFAYHLQKLGLDTSIECVLGFSSRRTDNIGHWWVQVNGVLIDLTADQFNVIQDGDLSYKLKMHRPYESVYCCDVSKSPHRLVFKIDQRNSFVFNCDDLHSDYFFDFERAYNLLMECRDQCE